MHLIEVAFKGNRREFFHWASEDPLTPRTPVIVEADRGEDLGMVHSTGELAHRRFAGVSHGEAAGPVEKRIVRVATPEEGEQEHRLRHEDDEAARRQAMGRVREHGLAMKVSDAEWQWDRKKLTLYFTAERRVDFRTLVRDLASTFRTRIELKQIGVRDEARRLDGVGRCGRQYCSASFLPELRPVNLGVAKDQGLSLNPLQISGACGRLMCCLRFEHEFYVQSRKRFPKEGRIIATALGEEKVVANDIFNDRVTLRNVEGDVRVVPLAELKSEIAGIGAGGGARHASNGAQPQGDGSGADQPEASDLPRHRALPVRGPSQGQTSTRPGRRYRTGDDHQAAPGARVAEEAPASAASEHADAAPARPGTGDERETTPPPPADDASVAPAPADAAPAAAPQATAAPAASDASDASAASAEPVAAAAADDSTDDPRRRRRRGRRGGRRGRAARDGAEHATDLGNGAHGAGTDDRGD